MIIVLSNSWLIILNKFITLITLSLSKLPVGSSASMIERLVATALAIETLCCSPPDKLSTFLLRILSIFSFFAIFKISS